MRLITPLVLIAALLSVSTRADAGVQPPSLVYRGASVALKANAVGTAVVAKCPKGSRVIGGGAGVLDDSGASRLVGSHPYDGRDADRKPDDGWRAVATNHTPEDTGLNVWATCDEEKLFAVRYVRSKAKMAPLTRTTTAAECRPDEEVTGGGALIHGKSDALHLVTSHPYDSDADGDHELDNLWSATGHHGSDRGAYELSAWAICAPYSANITYPWNSEPIASNPGMLNFRIDCAAPMSRVIGGGFDVFGDGALALLGSRPYTDDPDGIVDDGWSAAAVNFGEAEQVRVIAICLGP